jgi:decaprenylphospho-beta-D-erythro-pentofuranosid-2-ulose 2-reductase
MSGRIVILGALSAIAEATARRFAENGAALVLVARDEARLKELAADLMVRGAVAAHIVVCDLATEADPGAKMLAWTDQLGGLSAVLIAYGVLGDQAAAEKDLAITQQQITVNFTSAALWAQAAAAILEQQRSGTLLVIGSVAGDRGRASNYVYGAAKAGLATFTQGIAHRLAKVGARAVTIKPGFVDTPMTAGLAKGGPLWATPAQVADVIVKAADKGGPVAYAPWFWRFILLIIRAVPAFVFHKTKL